MSEPTEAQIEAFKAAWHEADEQGHEGDRVKAGLAAAMTVEPEPALRPRWISDAKIGAGVYLGFERGAWPIQAFSAELTHHILWVAKDPNNRVVIGPVHIPTDEPVTGPKVSTRTEPADLGEHQATVLYGGRLANAQCSCGWVSSLFHGDRSDAVRAASVEWADHLAAVSA